MVDARSQQTDYGVPVRLGREDAKLVRHIALETGESAAAVVRRIISTALPNLPDLDRRIAATFRP